VDTTWDYDVFGAVRDLTGSQPNDFTFAGEQTDGSTGLQYLRARSRTRYRAGCPVAAQRVLSSRGPAGDGSRR
jgi:hypothetical protein